MPRSRHGYYRPPPSAETEAPALEAKDLANVYLQQFAAARLSFDQRRSYQLKIGLAIWGALLTLVVGLLKGSEINLEPDKRWILPVTGVLALITHLYFLAYSQKAGKVDQRKAECFERLLNEMTKVPTTHLEPVKLAIQNTQQGFGKGRWVEAAHMLVTVILVIAMIVLA